MATGSGPGQPEATAIAGAEFGLPPRSASSLVRLGRLARKKPLGAISAVIIVVMVFAGIFAGVVSPFDPLEPHVRDRLSGPSTTYYMGTDQLGRDVFSRVVHGARTSLLIAIPAVALGVGIGSLIGIMSGFLGGWFDLIVQRFLDASQAIPSLILALAVIAVLGAGTDKVIYVIAFIAVPWNGRVVRGAVLAIKENQYIDAARAVGASSSRIMFRHILPNVVAPILVLVSVLLGAAIIIEASLSFLGLGVPPPNPSWGGMLSREGRAYMEQVPTLALFPGLAISLVVLAFNMLGDTLRDIWDPRLRGSQ
jgi:peptide/nickel transport system permease protein